MDQVLPVSARHGRRRAAALLMLPLMLGVNDMRSVATAASAPARARACFWPSQVSGFDDAGPQRTVVRIGTREFWELTLANGCRDVDYALDIGIVARAGERICVGRPASLIVPDASGTGAQRCLVTRIRRLSAGEMTARRSAPAK